ncbi:MAG: alkylhydroperoxidase [Xanthomonadales bacterium]|nr:alkylhydroperoxidase [Xanthomonadales bacterium]
MAYIKVVQPDVAEGKLADLFNRVRGPNGQVDNVLQIHSLRPHTMLGHMGLYKAVLHHPGNSLPAWFLESVGVLVSMLNACAYCEHHHSEGLKRLLQSVPGRYEACLAQLRSAEPGHPFTTAQSAALDYVRKLTLSPGAIARQDVDALRVAGNSDGEILEMNQVASYFAYVNRTVLGLGVSIEGELLGLSPQESADLEDWAHA